MGCESTKQKKIADKWGASNNALIQSLMQNAKTKNEKQKKTGQGSGFQNGQRKYEPGTQHLIVEEFYATLCAEDEED